MEKKWCWFIPKTKKELPGKNGRNMFIRSRIDELSEATRSQLKGLQI